MNSKELEELIAIGVEYGRILQQVGKKDRGRMIPMFKRFKEDLAKNPESNIGQIGMYLIDVTLASWADYSLNAKILDAIQHKKPPK